MADQDDRLEIAWQQAESSEEQAILGQRDWSEAALAWQTFVDPPEDGLHPSPHDRALALGRLGHSLAKLGRWAEAIEARARAVEILKDLAHESARDADSSTLAESMNDLAWMLAVSSRSVSEDPSVAVSLARGAVDLAPGRAAYHNTLGAALIRSGHWADAVVSLMRSVSLAPRDDSPFNHLLLSIAYANLGDPGAARKALDQADALMTPALCDHPEIVLLRLESTAAIASAEDSTLPTRP